MIWHIPTTPGSLIALMFASTSALSASKAAISFIMASGLRCVISSPPFGFLTERSNVVWSMVLASTLQLLGESANFFCLVLVPSQPHETCFVQSKLKAASLDESRDGTIIRFGHNPSWDARPKPDFFNGSALPFLICGSEGPGHPLRRVSSCIPGRR